MMIAMGDASTITRGREETLGGRLARWERVLILVVLAVALLTRLWGLGMRVQSHDESIHTKYSWNLFEGKGFQHHPLMHGPFLFHATAASYFILGDNDYAARVPVALMGVALVLMPFLLRRWLGRLGAAAASLLLLISPSIAYYSRYIRHDVPVALWSLLTILAVLGYLQDGRRRWLLLLAGAVSLAFATKEVAFIYNAIIGFFLVAVVLVRAWMRVTIGFSRWLWVALGLLLIGLLCLVVGLWLGRGQEVVPISLRILQWVGAGLAGAAIAGGLALILAAHLRSTGLTPPVLVLVLMAVALLIGVAFRLLMPVAVAWNSCVQGSASQEGRPTAIAACAWSNAPTAGLPREVGLLLSLLPVGSALLVGLSWYATRALGRYRSFDLVVLLGTLCLPLLSPLAMALVGVDAMSYDPPGVYYAVGIGVQFLVASVLVGFAWGRRRWPLPAAIYYGIFLVFFTTVFTNGYGLATGLAGSLGYWLKQQEVERGSQPLYYYVLTVGMYEFLPFLLALVTGLVWGVRRLLRRSRDVQVAGEMQAPLADGEERSPVIGQEPAESGRLFVPFLIWWVIGAWLAYTIAGERMPWLTVHIALPMILLGGWGLGRLLDARAWRRLASRQGVWLLLLLPLGGAAALGLIRFGSVGPFGGYRLDELIVTGRFLGALVGVALTVPVIIYLGKGIGWGMVCRAVLAMLLLVPVALTVRTSWRFCTVNADYALELLVYAHAAPGVRRVIDRIELLSKRVVEDPKAIDLAYGSEGAMLFDWQFRNFPNAVFYGENPTRETMDRSVIVAGQGQWEDVEPYLGDEYVYETYPYIWWPLEDYKGLTWERVWRALADPAMRRALWDIWYARDYGRYGELKEKDLSPDDWPYPFRLDVRLYVRRDVAANLWDVSVMDVPLTTQAAGEAAEADPYEAGWRDLQARMVIGEEGVEAGQFLNPRGLAVDSDGAVYVADAGNHRVQKLSPSGEPEAVWPVAEGAGHVLNEPWGVAVEAGMGGTDRVYVADTWNHRIVVLDTSGRVVRAWGEAGQASGGDQTTAPVFFGPRDIAVGQTGLIYVTDTGNKRIQVFAPDGSSVRSWGSGGVVEGYLDEPVGIAIGPDGDVYVADTWNQRVQVFSPQGQFLRQWPVTGWQVADIEEKPYLAVDQDGLVYVTDPSSYRVLVFDSAGNYLLSFGQYGVDDRSFTYPLGVAVGVDGSIYVSDAHSGRILVYDAIEVELPGATGADEALP